MTTKTRSQEPVSAGSPAHSAGPWRAEYDPTRPEASYYLLDRARNPVAHISVNRKPDAHLIAAAPELHAALVAVEARLSRVKSDDPQTTARDLAALEMAWDALSSAKGMRGWR